MYILMIFFQQNASKVLYIRYDLQPNKKLCGGVFWDAATNKYDIAFIETLKQFFYKKLTDNIHASVKQLQELYTREIKDAGISQVELEIEDVQHIVNILLYDGQVDPVVTANEDKTLLYRPSYVGLLQLNITEIPCVCCPVAKNCSDTGDITPETCVYFQQWLDF